MRASDKVEILNCLRANTEVSTIAKCYGYSEKQILALLPKPTGTAYITKVVRKVDEALIKKPDERKPISDEKKAIQKEAGRKAAITRKENKSINTIVNNLQVITQALITISNELGNITNKGKSPVGSRRV